jgi:hypothetical protein
MSKAVKVRLRLLASASVTALLALGAGGVAAAFVSSGSPGQHQATTTIDGGYTGWCGTELRHIKDLTDRAATEINFTPREANIWKLGSIPPPDPVPSTRTAREKGVYRLKIYLQKAKLMDDSDIQLIVAGHAGRRMITELPAAQCEKGAVHESDIDQARADFVHACGLPGRRGYSALGGTATITGVFFFDQPERQTDAAPNYAELHPLLSFSTASCFGSDPPPPPPPCVVVDVKELALTRARSTLLRADCRLGSIRLAYSRRIRRGRVIAQRPVPHTVWPNGTKVRVTVSRGHEQ